MSPDVAAELAVWLASEGTFRKPNQTLLDLRVSRTFKLARGVQFEPIVDLYNILNENASVAEVEIVGEAGVTSAADTSPALAR